MNKDTKASTEATPQGQAVSPQATDRRSFLGTATVGIAGLCGVGLSLVAGRASVPDVDDGGPRRFFIGALSDYRMNTATPLRDRDLFIVRGEGGIAALSARCTHLGCTVRRTESGFSCPCHGAQFGHRGESLSGPQRRGLPWYAIAKQPDGRLTVDLDTEVEPLDVLARSGDDRP